MANYSVTVLFDATKGMDIEADSPDEAEEKVLKKVGMPCLCHQCSDEVEVAEAIGAFVYLDGELVRDTTFLGERDATIKVLNERIAQLEAELAAAKAGK